MFGPWHFNAITGDLYDGETTTRLEPQVAKLLEYFLAHQNKLISRDELIAEVWDKRIVSDDAINRCISILRQILSPNERNAYFETVVRKGFISHFPAVPVKTAHPAPRARHRHFLVLATIAAAAGIVYLAFELFNDSSGEVQFRKRENPPLVAVLPFTTSGMSGDIGFFANGMHDDLLTQLAQLQSLRVVSRTSVLGYRDTTKNTREIGEELGADAILEGGVQSVGNQIRINMQLIDARSDEHLWAGQYDRELLPTKVFEVQKDITSSIASALNTSLTKQDMEHLSVLPTENMAAYRAYHQAIEIRHSTSSNEPAYISELENAVSLDPNFVRAWVELAGALCLSNFNTQDPDSVHRIENILEHIRALAPESADYLVAQSYFTYYILKNYDQSYELVSRALDLQPNDVFFLELKSWIQRRQGDFAGKIESTRRIRALDPKNPLWTLILVQDLMTNHQFAEANQLVSSSSLQDQYLPALNNDLQLQKHHDFSRWLENLEAIKTEYGDDSQSVRLWNAYIANRKFVMAEKSLAAVDVAGKKNYFRFVVQYSDFALYPIITYWFLDDTGRLDLALNQAEKSLGEQIAQNGGLVSLHQNLTLAYISAARGNVKETERLIRAWRRAAAEDLAELVNTRHFACRALGMVAATAAAVECIRAGLEGPSGVMPFMEPYLPYYDSIRETPEFIALLSEVETN